MRALDLEAALDPKAPQLTAAVLVIPLGLLEIAGGESESVVAARAKNTKEVEERAVAAVMAAEIALGRRPEEMPHNNPGFDIRSEVSDGHVLFVEVKGRISGSDSVTVTYNEIMVGRNTPELQILALVDVSPDGGETVRYVRGAFANQKAEPMFGEVSRTFNWKKLWAMGTDPS